MIYVFGNTCIFKLKIAIHVCIVHIIWNHKFPQIMNIHHTYAQNHYSITGKCEMWDLTLVANWWFLLQNYLRIPLFGEIHIKIGITNQWIVHFYCNTRYLFELHFLQRYVRKKKKKLVRHFHGCLERKYNVAQHCPNHWNLHTRVSYTASRLGGCTISKWLMTS